MQVSTLVSLAQSQMGDGNVLAARWLFLLSQALWLPYFLLIPVWSLSAFVATCGTTVSCAIAVAQTYQQLNAENRAKEE
jgi:hypothetical protein